MDSRNLMKFLSVLFTFAFSSSFIFATPVINFTAPTPANGSTITTDYVEINSTIDENSLHTFRFNWNGTNYSFYDPSLVLALNFNNNSAIGESGTKVVDISMYGNNGTCYNMGTTCNYTTGRFGMGISFDGINDYIEIPNSPSLKMSNAVTISVWVNFKSFPQAYQNVLS
ncbi:MAG: hypothetical protein NZ903_03270, partial [Candidatus Micrarchaeota archaeon]|nr:hypothetical protein [Candidatus Micrarchaeota archaeon]